MEAKALHSLPDDELFPAWEKVDSLEAGGLISPADATRRKHVIYRVMMERGWGRAM